MIVLLIGVLSYVALPVHAWAENTAVKDVWLNDNVSAALTEDGQLYTWGSNGAHSPSSTDDAALGDGTNSSRNAPHCIIDDVKEYFPISSLYENTYGHHPVLFSAVIRNDGTLWTWGQNDTGAVGNGTDEECLSPVKVLDDVVDFDSTGSVSAALKSDGSLWMWGANSSGELCNDSGESSYTPIHVMDDVVQFSIERGRGFNSTRATSVAAVKSDGSLWMWGENREGQLGCGISGPDSHLATPVKVLDDVAWVKIFSGDDYYNGPGVATAAITTDGSLYLWGENWEGRLGVGTEDDVTVPTKVLSSVKSFQFVGDTTGVAVTKDGELWMWGDNNNYELGNDTYYDELSPIKVMDDVAAFYTREHYQGCFALKSDGSIWAWGLSAAFQSPQHTPVKLLEDVSEIVLGRGAEAAIKTDGSLWMWGSNTSGELGNGTLDPTFIPIEVMDMVKEVRLGSVYNSAVAAIKYDGSLWVWGENYYGNLGTGDEEDKLIPVCIFSGASLADADGDALPDAWETASKEEAEELGIPWLAGMGADPNKPDVFVEVDWMCKPVTYTDIDGGDSWIRATPTEMYRPSDSQMTLVAETFAAHGVNLHIDTGPTSVDYVTGKEWGDLSEATQVPYQEIDYGMLEDDDWSSVFDVAGSPSTDDASRDAFSGERRKVFHYCLSIGSFVRDGKKSDATGISLQPEHKERGDNSDSAFFSDGGQYFVIASGVIQRTYSTYDYGGQCVPAPDGVGGTFMHELGHNLGLGHGGNQGYENYKPNYRSVMNYDYQLIGLPRSGDEPWLLDYSNVKLPNLDEEALVEKDGVDPDGLYEGKGASIRFTREDDSVTFVEDVAFAGIDWNEDGKIGESDTKVKSDINGDSRFSTLTGSNDWDHLVYGGGNSIGIAALASDASALASLTSEVSTLAEEETVSCDFTISEAIASDTLARPGTANAKLSGPFTVIKGASNQKLFVLVENMSHAADDFTVTAEGDLFEGERSQVVHVDGSTSIPLTAETVMFPISDSASVGEHTITLTVSGTSGSSSTFTYVVDVYSPTEGQLESLNDALESGDLGLSGVVADQYREVLEAELGDPESKPVELTSANVAPIPNQAWTGNPVCPKPVVTVDGATLVEGADYACSYENNVSPGMATLIVSGQGAYTGTVKVEFRIVRDGADAPDHPTGPSDPGTTDPGDPDAPGPERPWDNPFIDVAETDWFYGAVRDAYDMGIMQGYDDGSGRFGPLDVLTREQAAAVIFNYFGEGDRTSPEAPHVDVIQGQWYSAAVNWSVANEVMRGYGDDVDTFGVGDSLTREQFAAIIANVAKADVSSSDASELESFPDASGVSDWAERVMAWAVKSGVIRGFELPDGSRELRATAGITRAEMAAMVINAIEVGVL